MSQRPVLKIFLSLVECQNSEQNRQSIFFFMFPFPQLQTYTSSWETILRVKNWRTAKTHRGRSRRWSVVQLVDQWSLLPVKLSETVKRLLLFVTETSWAFNPRSKTQGVVFEIKLMLLLKEGIPDNGASLLVFCVYVYDSAAKVLTSLWNTAVQSSAVQTVIATGQLLVLQLDWKPCKSIVWAFFHKKSIVLVWMFLPCLWIRILFGLHQRVQILTIQSALNSQQELNDDNDRMWNKFFVFSGFLTWVCLTKTILLNLEFFYKPVVRAQKHGVPWLFCRLIASMPMRICTLPNSQAQNLLESLRTYR